MLKEILRNNMDYVWICKCGREVSGESLRCCCGRSEEESNAEKDWDIQSKLSSQVDF